MRDERVVGEHDAAASAATDGELVAEREALAVAGGRFEDAQASGTAALGGLGGLVAARRAALGGAAGCSGTGAGARISFTTTRTTRNRNR